MGLRLPINTEINDRAMTSFWYRRNFMHNHLARAPVRRKKTRRSETAAQFSISFLHRSFFYLLIAFPAYCSWVNACQWFSNPAHLSRTCTFESRDPGITIKTSLSFISHDRNSTVQSCTVYYNKRAWGKWSLLFWLIYLPRASALISHLHIIISLIYRAK